MPKFASVLSVLLLLALAVAHPWRMLDHSFTNCGSSSDPVTVQTIDLNPDPVQPGKKLAININATAKVNMTGGKIQVTATAWGVPA